ncbi:hypothetical protein [Neobacillus niacini]|uniref:hypothetical protein n=1 Tax=Neobacillus niacini TaxID=86668 RepID=UPI00203D217F|nr:hypothetical protein [Neobacillus niacini]MCM3690848.1 hypothetical protein [Neobacillus niacini]
MGSNKDEFRKPASSVTEAQNNLVELEGLIAYQSDNNWTELNLVTTELGDVLNGIWLGMTTGKQLGTLSKRDKEILENLYSKLDQDQYPNDELYSFADLTESDKKNLEDLRKTLREVGLGVNITISVNMDSFMDQAEALNERIESPLN